MGRRRGQAKALLPASQTEGGRAKGTGLSKEGENCLRCALS